MKKKEKTTEERMNDLNEKNKKARVKAKTFWADFKKFAAKGNIIDLAVAVVVGTAFNSIVNALVKNILTPLISMLLPSGDLKNLKWVLEPAVEANEELGIAAAEEVAVTYGVFLEAVIDFFIIALTIYVVMKTFLNLKSAIHKKEREAQEQKTRELEAKKKAEAEAEAARLEKIKNDFIQDVAVQADVLTEIKDIMLRMEKRLNEE